MCLMLRYPRVLLALVALAACKDGVKLRVADAVVADLSLLERAEVLAARAGLTQAGAEREKAVADRVTAERDQVKVKAGIEQAGLERTRVAADLKLAEARNDGRQVDEARGHMRLAELAEAAMKERRAWVAARLSLHDAERVAAEAHALAADARIELARARIAHSKGRRAGAALADFERQAAEFAKRHDARVATVEARVATVEARQRRYDDLIGEYAGVRGRLAGASPGFTPPGYVPPRAPASVARPPTAAPPETTLTVAVPPDLPPPAPRPAPDGGAGIIAAP